MPSKNSRKLYVEGGYYHIYNRGVEKRKIFMDETDYGTFLSYLKAYLTPKNKDKLYTDLSNPKLNWIEREKVRKLLSLNNFYKEISLLCFCLMPNHFHMLIKQKSADAMDKFMNSLNTRYVMYFNKKYNRIGPLYQGTYKAVLVKSNEQLLHISFYIHTNPNPQGHALRILLSQPSSLPEYLGNKNTTWINTKEILSFFSKENNSSSYKEFILRNIENTKILSGITID